MMRFSVFPHECQESSNTQAGFSFILFLLVCLVILGATAGSYYIIHDNSLSHRRPTIAIVTSGSEKTSSSLPSVDSNQQIDPYEGWQTCTDTIEGLSFKIPPAWEVYGGSTSSCADALATLNSYGSGVVVLSSAVPDSPEIFRLEYSDRQWSDSLCSAPVDGQPIIKAVLTLQVAKSTIPASLITVESTPYKDTPMAELDLTDYPYLVGQSTGNTLYIFTSKHADSTRCIYMRAFLTKPNNNMYEESHTWSEITSHVDYQTLLKVFEPLSY